MALFKCSKCGKEMSELSEWITSYNVNARAKVTCNECWLKSSSNAR